MKPWHMGTHLRVLSKSYPMNTNMIGLRWFSKEFVYVLELMQCQDTMITIVLHKLTEIALLKEIINFLHCQV